MSNYTVTGIPAAQTRASSSQVRGEFVLVSTAINSKGDIAGQVWTGAHDFSAASSFKVPTPVNPSDAATKSYADNLSFSGALPTAPGGTATYKLTSVSGVAGWSLDATFSNSVALAQAHAIALSF